MNGERWQTDLDAFQTRAKQLGAEVISADAKGDDDLQFQQVQDMIKAGIKTLVLLPHDTTKAARMVDAAKAAHVNVISYDRLVQNTRRRSLHHLRPRRHRHHASRISGQPRAQGQLRPDRRLAHRRRRHSPFTTRR